MDDAAVQDVPVVAPSLAAPVPRRADRWRRRVSGLRLTDLAALAVASPGAQRLVVRTPFDGEVLGEVPLATATDVRPAAARARLIQEDWAQRSWSERGAIFLRLHDLLLDRQEELLDFIQLESGKARKHAFEEVADAAIVSRYYAVHAEEHLAARSRMGALPALTQTFEQFLPLGVIGIVSPWNYPLSLALTDAIPALMAGNAVLLKPDRQTPFTALAAAELLAAAGLPEGLFQVLAGEGSQIAPAFIAETDGVTFTGSTATGRQVARQCSERLIGCSLELGGKNAMVVLADADLDAAVAGAVRGCFSSAGQLCISIERLYVHDSIHRRFLSRFVAETRAMRLGCALDYGCDMGSLASEKQLRTVVEHVDDAVAQGARVETGGRPRPDLGPWFYEPTILTGVRPSMVLASEETFGPVVAVYPFASLHDAIERVNATRYGLNASLWTSDVDLARRIAGRLRVGTVNVNEAYAAAWASVDSPMGGCKDSGLGRRHGEEGIRKYTDPQTVAVQRVLPLAAPEGVADELFSRVLSQTLRVLKRVPGLR